MKFEKIILVFRRTRLEGLIERFNTRPQARFYIEHSSEYGAGAFELYEREHETYYSALGELRLSLRRLAKIQEVERSFLPNFLFAEDDLVVTIGVDGLVVNTAKYLDGQPLVAVNPDPARIDGVLLPFDIAHAAGAVQRVKEGRARWRSVSMAQARLADGQIMLAFNDLFIGARSHVSARYTIQAENRSEHHSSSGVIISTGAGATGWLSSIFNMANGLASAFAPQRQESASLPYPELAPQEDRLIYIVREPFISKTSGASLVCGTITPGAPLILQSEMPEGGVIFSDGIESDFLEFNAGAHATISLAEKKTHLVING